MIVTFLCQILWNKCKGKGCIPATERRYASDVSAAEI